MLCLLCIYLFFLVACQTCFIFWFIFVSAYTISKTKLIFVHFYSFDNAFTVCGLLYIKHPDCVTTDIYSYNKPQEFFAGV